LPFREETLVVGYRAVPTAKSSGASIGVQEIGGLTDNKQLWFTPADDQGWLEVPFQVDKSQTVELWVRMLHSWDYGTYRVRLDGAEVATLDLFSQNLAPTSHKLGSQTLAAGEHRLRFECVGKAKDSKGWFLGFDALRARVPVYARDPKVDLRTLQKR
jgi:hypothetical protein